MYIYLYNFYNIVIYFRNHTIVDINDNVHHQEYHEINIPTTHLQ